MTTTAPNAQAWLAKKVRWRGSFVILLDGNRSGGVFCLGQPALEVDESGPENAWVARSVCLSTSMRSAASVPDGQGWLVFPDRIPAKASAPTVKARRRHAR